MAPGDKLRVTIKETNFTCVCIEKMFSSQKPLGLKSSNLL
jgi:hypothetical protein